MMNAFSHRRLDKLPRPGNRSKLVPVRFPPTRRLTCWDGFSRAMQACRTADNGSPTRRLMSYARPRRVGGAVSEGFADSGSRDCIIVIEIGNRPRHFEHTVIAPRRE